MSARDLIILALVAWGCLAALKRPWIGVMLWTWLSIMNPHRYTWGWAYSAPVAQAAALVTLLGLLLTQDRASPFKGAAPVFLALFTLWVTLSWLFGLDSANDYEQWKKVIKINFMIFIALALLHSKQHVIALVWVCTGSLALLGVKGGAFTVLHGGNYRVWGPPGSFIEDNNEFALALIMTIPLLRFLQMQVSSAWSRHVLTVSMLLCAASAFGSHSRGALLAIGAMSAVLWWRGPKKILSGLAIVIVGIGLLVFMPEQWTERMATISEYEEDDSAMGRISAWSTAIGVANNYPFGAGFNVARHDLFERFSPYYSGTTHAAHSIYFQVLGNHGYIGMILFLSIWIATWRTAAWLRKYGSLASETKWCADLGSMCQVSLVGYAVGGAFLSLSYFDLPYNIMTMVVVARMWVQTRGWEREPVYSRSWKTLPGLAPPVLDRT